MVWHGTMYWSLTVNFWRPDSKTMNTECVEFVHKYVVYLLAY